jgi:hypothetical protein
MLDAPFLLLLAVKREKAVERQKPHCLFSQFLVLFVSLFEKDILTASSGRMIVKNVQWVRCGLRYFVSGTEEYRKETQS